MAKVDELLALCDELTARQAAQRKARTRLVGATFDRLVASNSSAEFPTHAKRLRDNFDSLFDTPTTVPQLRQLILRLAFQGRLVPQEHSGESATDLLLRIAMQKTQSGVERTGRDWVADFEPVCGPYELPPNWTWTRIGNTVERVTVGHVGPMKDQYVNGGVPFLRCQNVRPNRFDPKGLVFISQDFHESLEKSSLAPGDVVVVRSGANVGMACVIPSSLKQSNCSDLVIAKNPSAVLPAYLSFYLNSLGALYVSSGSVGVALPHFNTKSVATMPLALPPIAEQERIVTKINTLMSICDDLEFKLKQVESASSVVLSVAAHHLITT